MAKEEGKAAAVQDIDELLKNIDKQLLLKLLDSLTLEQDIKTVVTRE